jgi:hypothetical protein
VIVVKNLQIPYVEKCMTTLLSQEGFCSMESVTSNECARNRVNVFERGI